MTLFYWLSFQFPVNWFCTYAYAWLFLLVISGPWLFLWPCIQNGRDRVWYMCPEAGIYGHMVIAPFWRNHHHVYWEDCGDCFYSKCVDKQKNWAGLKLYKNVIKFLKVEAMSLVKFVCILLGITLHWGQTLIHPVTGELLPSAPQTDLGAFLLSSNRLSFFQSLPHCLLSKISFSWITVSAWHVC